MIKKDIGGEGGLSVAYVVATCNSFQFSTKLGHDTRLINIRSLRPKGEVVGLGREKHLNEVKKGRILISL